MSPRRGFFNRNNVFAQIRYFQAVDELVDQNMVTDLERLLH